MCPAIEHALAAQENVNNGPGSLTLPLPPCAPQIFSPPSPSHNIHDTEGMHAHGTEGARTPFTQGEGDAAIVGPLSKTAQLLRNKAAENGCDAASTLDSRTGACNARNEAGSCSGSSSSLRSLCSSTCSTQSSSHNQSGCAPIFPNSSSSCNGSSPQLHDAAAMVRGACFCVCGCPCNVYFIYYVLLLLSCLPG